MVHGKRVFITAEIIKKAKEEQKEKELLLYVTELMEQNRLQNPEILEQCMSAAEGDAFDEDARKLSYERIYQNVIGQAVGNPAGKKRRQWVVAMRAVAAGIVLCLLLFRDDDFTYASKTEKMTVELVRDENRVYTLYYSGDYAEDQIPVGLRDVWVPERFVCEKTDVFKADNQISYTLCFKERGGGAGQCFVSFTRYESGEGQVRIGQWLGQEEAYACNGKVYYIKFRAHDTTACEWAEGALYYTVRGSLTVDEMKQVLASCDRILHRR